MKTRVISAVVVLPLLVAIMAVGGPLLMVVIYLATLIGFYELFRAVNMNVKSLDILAFLHISGSFILYFLDYSDYLYVGNVLFVLLVLAVYALKFPKIQLGDLAVVFFGVFYILFLMLAIVFVRNDAFYGEWFIWLIFVIAFGSDSGAYFMGVNFGKKPLAPQLSPNKTIEGAYGGLLGSGLLCLIFGLIMYFFGPFTNFAQVASLVGVGILGSVVSQIGDLVGSAMKRQTGIKDFGNVIPGHGGILDRLDSILVTAGYVFVMQALLGFIL